MSSSFWHKRNVFITGGQGLLGPWLIVDLLARGAEVVALVRDNVHCSLFNTWNLDRRVVTVRGDLSDLYLLQRILNEYEIDTVFHLGAQAVVGIANRSPLSTFKSNIEGTYVLLEACRLSPWVKHIVVASSDKAYGDQPVLPYTEDMPLQGKYPYDVSKSCADLITQSYAHTYGIPVCIARCGNFFGGGDFHFNRIVPGTIRSILVNEPPIIRSNGLLIRDYIYVKDIVMAYVMLAELMTDKELAGQAFNFSTDFPFTVIDLVHKILKIANRENLVPIVQNNAVGEIQHQHLSSKKAHRVLGWTPHYGVDKGLAETFTWYSSFFSQEGKRGSEKPNAVEQDNIMSAEYEIF